MCRRRVSVCPSATRRYWTKTAKCRITQSTPHDSPGTLVSYANNLGKIPVASPPMRRQMCQRQRRLLYYSTWQLYIFVKWDTHMLYTHWMVVSRWTSVSDWLPIDNFDANYFDGGSGGKVLQWAHLCACHCVCLSVCLFTSISPKPHSQSSPFFVHVAYHRGLVLHCRGDTVPREWAI